MKVVINRCHGGFSLSREAIKRVIELQGDRYDPNQHIASDWDEYYPIDRDDPAVVQAVEELGETANGSYAKLAIVDVPDGVDWEIDEYDGMERIRERSRYFD